MKKDPHFLHHVKPPFFSSAELLPYDSQVVGQKGSPDGLLEK